MGEHYTLIELDDIPDELWEQMVEAKAKYAPDMTMDEWVNWLVRKGIEIELGK